MSLVCPPDRERVKLPDAAEPAVAIVQGLRDAGHTALLAGGCVRDLLLGREPSDFDVATDASPESVCALFRATRKVGAQFGVVLVRKHGRWVEVATFRSDGPYLDGRHPATVTFSDARHDAERRDFTVNGMFLDPASCAIIDYVGGQADLASRVIRAIGDPARRFAEDHLRVLRAPRFAARLDFAIEPATASAIRSAGPQLARVAAERIRDELERMLATPTRRRAWQWLDDLGLLPHIWRGAAVGSWTAARVDHVGHLFEHVSPDAPFVLALAIILGDVAPVQVDALCRELACSNDEREDVVWLVEHQGDLDQPGRPSRAEFKRLMAHRAFPALRGWAHARARLAPDGATRSAELETRLATIPPESVQPPPLITGGDLIARGVVPGPAFSVVLDDLYTQQLNETLQTREAALAALDAALQRHAPPLGPPRKRPARRRPRRSGK